MNIYDFAGNEYEWTLEKATYSSYHCSSRGGRYSHTGSTRPASYRDYNDTNYSNDYIGFRTTLYVK